MSDTDLIKVLNRFHEHLRDAKLQYESDGEAGRGGMALAVSAAAEFVLSLEEMCAEDLAIPLVALASALGDLDHGRVGDALKPKQFDNRPPDSRMRQAIRAYSAITVELLIVAGFAAGEAAKIVARHLVRENVNVSGRRSLTGKTVADWRYQCRESKATQFCQSIWDGADFSKYRIPSDNPKVVKEALLAQLSLMISATRTGSLASN